MMNIKNLKIYKIMNVNELDELKWVSKWRYRLGYSLKEKMRKKKK